MGLFILAVGIVFSIKANIGVSPVSSMAYSITLITAVDMGIVTVVWQCAMVLIQLAVYRKDFPKKDWLQVPVGVVFGSFTSLALALMAFIPISTNIFLSIFYDIISIVVIALGICLYVRADIVAQANEGVVAMMADKLNMDFSQAKIRFDILMAVLSGVLCLTFTKSWGSIGIGTIASAFLIGPCVGIWGKILFDKEKV